MGKLIAIGECLVDFLPGEPGRKLADVETFQRRAGGAPANVAVCVARLGGASRFVGKVGKDAFGDYLRQTLSCCGVDTSALLATSEAKTALAFVSLAKDGERDFSFYRDPSADMLLTEKETGAVEVGEGDVVHFGSVALSASPVRAAHRPLLNQAHAAGALTSFDVNIRLPLYPSAEAARAAVEEFLPEAELVKMSREELEFLRGGAGSGEIAGVFASSPRLRCLIVTDGAKGSEAHFPGGASVFAPAYPVRAVDATGAGDCFVGCVLYRLLRGAPLAPGEMEDVLRFAAAGAAVTVSRMGAIDAMPTLAEIEQIYGRKSG